MLSVVLLDHKRESECIHPLKGVGERKGVVNSFKILR